MKRAADHNITRDTKNTPRVGAPRRPTAVREVCHALNMSLVWRDDGEITKCSPSMVDDSTKGNERIHI